MSKILDTRNVLKATNGQIAVTVGGKSYLLAEVESMQAKVSFTNQDIQPVGSAMSMGIPMGFSVTVSLSEFAVRDDVTLKPIYDAMQTGEVPYFDIACKLTRRDGKVNRQVFRDCIPDADFDLYNLSPGDIVKRATNFRVNRVPDLQEYISDPD